MTGLLMNINTHKCKLKISHTLTSLQNGNFLLCVAHINKYLKKKIVGLAEVASVRLKWSLSQPFLLPCETLNASHDFFFYLYLPRHFKNKF